MRVRERVIASRILEMASVNQEYAQRIGVSGALKKIGRVHDGSVTVNQKTVNDLALQLKTHE